MAKAPLDLLIAGKREAVPYEYEIIISKKPCPISLRFQPPTDIERAAVAGLYQSAARRYITGGWTDDDGKEHKEPDEILDGNGQPIKLDEKSREALWNAARAEIIQAPENEADRYNVVDFIRMMVAPDSPFYKINEDAHRHYNGEGWAKNG